MQQHTISKVFTCEASSAHCFKITTLLSSCPICCPFHLMSSRVLHDEFFCQGLQTDHLKSARVVLYMYDAFVYLVRTYTKQLRPSFNSAEIYRLQNVGKNMTGQNKDGAQFKYLKLSPPKMYTSFLAINLYFRKYIIWNNVFFQIEYLICL